MRPGAAAGSDAAPASAAIPLRLELLTEAQLPDLLACLSDPDVLRYTRFPTRPPDGFVRDWFSGYLAGRAEGTKEAFAAVGDDGAFLGLALAPHIDAQARELELGYLVAPAFRGRGVASELLRQLTDWAFGTAGALRASLIIDVGNVASLRVASNAGYQAEGVLRSTYFKEGLRTDVAVWSRLASDPAPAR